MRLGLLGTRGVPARYGGFETAAEEIGRRLVEHGHDVVVYCRNPGQHLDRYEGMALVNLPAVRVQAVETLSHTALSVGHALLRDRLDVAFVFNAANAPFLPLLRAAGVPVAVHTDGLEWRRAKWGRRASAYYCWAEGRSARWADAVIADAEGIVDHLERAHGVHAHYLPYGAHLVDPDPGRLGKLGLDPGSYHLLVARLEPENHVREIVAGYVASRSRLPLVVVGDTAYAAAYRGAVLAATRGDERVRFVGSIWDQDLLDALYAHCASYLHGHSVGGTNPSLLRAMGAGAAVTAFDVSFNREVVGAAGLWFHDTAGVARACESVESDLPAARRRGRAGQADVVARYRWDDVALGYEALAKELLARPEHGWRSRRGR
jgi:glycosyltransferase involved in cell wall biosynthesis